MVWRINIKQKSEENGGHYVINIVICDDEKYMSDTIKKMVSEFSAEKI